MALLDNGASALQAFQRALNTTSHNIANVNTEGYTRQSVEFSSRLPQGEAVRFGGAGVEVGLIKRHYDSYLTDNVRSYQASVGQADTYNNYTSRMDNLFADPNTGLSARLQDFFTSVQDVSNDPSSVPARTAMLSEAQTLSSRFNELDNYMSGLNNEVNNRVRGSVTEINTLATSIAAMNEQIANSSGGQPPNDLMDKRDLLVNKLSEQINIQTIDGGDGTLSVNIGSGQRLVTGSQAEQLTVVASSKDSSVLEVGYSTKKGTVNISSQLSGGILGGAQDFRNEVLTPARNELGRMATVFAQKFNEQHASGVDLNGAAGTDMFTVSSPDVSSVGTNTGSASLTAGFDDVTNLKASAYVMTYDSASSSWGLTRESDGASVAFTSGDGSAGNPYVADGMSLVVGGTPADGDKFVIQPVRNGAKDIAVQLTDPKTIAAAGTGGAGDNENALALADLQNANLIDGGSMSVQSSYGQLVSTVGTRAHHAQLTYDAQKVMYDSAVAARDNVSGVNLDEEAANLIKYQQAYQAAAKVISVSDSLFQSLLSAM